MWPLSRKNNPKQFIQINNNHSIFQETVARNMAFCDEFIISTSTDYESIIENQMKAFKGLTYRCIYEDIGRGTAAPIIMTSLSLPESEILFVVSSDHLIAGDSYKDDILHAKELAKSGSLVTFGMDTRKPDTRFGYVKCNGEDVVEFTDKPDEKTAEAYFASGDYYTNSGMFMFRIGEFLHEVKTYSPYMISACTSGYYMKRTVGNKTYYSEDVLDAIPNQSIEKTVFEHTAIGKCIHSKFDWKDVGSLDDLEDVSLGLDTEEQLISNKCENTTVINRCSDKLVLVNHLKDVMVVNTEDAIYIGNKGDSNDLKEIIHDSQSMWGYFDKSRLFYRVWGQSQILEEDPKEGYQVRKVTVLPGRTITSHTHMHRNEVWNIVSGSGVGVVDGKELELEAGDTVSIAQGISHQLSCTGENSLVFIETATGLSIDSEDFVTVTDNTPSEAALGYEIEPFVKLTPSYKDYLWGGTRLRELFGKECDYDIIAESWEMSAHPDGQSVVASGRYKGMQFGEYLQKIGADNLGWKYQGSRAFPLLIKLIDAKQDLSVQVHPDDDYALEHENEYGKSELWHIIDAAPDSYIYVGFKKKTNREELLSAIKDGTVTELLNKVSVKPGEDYFIPAGTIHAIGKGILVCEVQQNSNSTYRLYDYDRVDKFGNKRHLDIDKALDVIDYSAYAGNKECKYFECEHIFVKKQYTLDTNDESFYAIMVLDGCGELIADKEHLAVQKGDCIFVPKRSKAMKAKGELELFTARI